MKQKREEFVAQVEAFKVAEAMNSVESPYEVATRLGSRGWDETDELANAIALWAISFVGALNDKARG